MIAASHVIPNGYKQTEVGVIPSSWEVAELQDVCGPTITYGIVQCGPHIDNGVPYIRVSDMSSRELEVSGMLRTSPAIAAQFSRSTVREGEIVYAMRGQIGEVRRVPADVDGANLTQGTARISPNGRVDAGYLLWALRSRSSLRQGHLEAKGSTFREITLAEIRRIEVPIPPLAEQEAIAEALGDADALIESLEQLVAKKRHLKQAAMQQLLTGKKRLPGFEGEWEPRTIESLESAKLMRLSRGDVISKKDIERSPGDFPIYSSSVKGGGLFGHYGKFMFDEELITWSVDGGGHFFHRPKHKFSVTNVCGAMHVDHDQLCCRFVATQLQVLHSQQSFDYLLKAHPSVIRKAYTLMLPRLAEQTAISDVISEMEDEIEAIEAKLSKARQIKQGMMQELLTGRTRLV